ncbi:MAG: hypothetical protein EXS09_20395 [Gemmataceae bacterium]|nr:hypothetical protein [Gemmataceae bacterium]
MQFYDEEPPTPLDRVRALAEHLNLLALRVRQAVSQAVSETVARLAHDATSQIMDKLANPVIDPDDDEDYREEYGSWGREPPRIVVGAIESTTMSTEQRVAIDRAIAAGLATAAWLLRRGRPWSALGLGTVVAAAVATGSKTGRRGLNLTGTLAELVSLVVPLTRGATRTVGS